MTRSTRWMLPLLLVLLLLPTAAAQRSFDDTTSVVVVEIPVTVTDGTSPVRGLTAEDFEVFDGRRKQDLVGFDVVDLSVSRATEKAAFRAPLPPAGRRHFLLLFDLSFSDPSSIIRARDAARDLVVNDLHPEDLAAVAVYSVENGPRLILGFTPDRAQLQLAIDTLGNPRVTDAGRDPLQLVFGKKTLAPQGAGRQTQALQATDEVLQEYLEDLAGGPTRANRDELRGRVAVMTRQMAALARLVASVEGRKHVVYLSEGIPDDLLVGSGGGGTAGTGGRPGHDPEASGALGTSPDASASDLITGGELWRVDTSAMFGSGQAQNDIQQMLEEFRRADCTIQAVDIGGLRAGGAIVAQESGANSLSQMASETGGQVYRNFNDLGEAMGQMLEKTSVTYLLAIQPASLKLDGKYHRLRVKLKDAPRRYELYHRPGYYAPLPLSEQSGLERVLRTAQRVLGVEGGDIATAVLASPFPAAGKAYVPVLIEVDGDQLLEGTSGDVLPVEVYTYALDEAGSVHDFFTQTLPLDIQQAGGSLRQTGLKYYGHLDLAPGDYTVRVLVRNLESGMSSLEVLPVTVPDYGSGTPVLTPPLFPEPLGKWVLVREGEDRQRNVPFPFILKQQPFLPAAQPVLARRGETEVPVMAFNLGTGALQVDARLLAADGSEQEGCDLAGVERMASATTGGDTLVLKLKSSGLKPGSYTLEVRVTDASSGRESVTTTPVQVAEKA